MSKNLEITYLLDFYGDMLTEKQRTAIEYYYNDDLSLAEIAEAVNISRQGVRDAVKRAEQTLLELEDTLGLAKRFSDVKQGLEQIIEAAEQIDSFNKTDKIKDCTQKIIKTAERLLDD